MPQTCSNIPSTQYIHTKFYLVTTPTHHNRGNLHLHLQHLAATTTSHANKLTTSKWHKITKTLPLHEPTQKFTTKATLGNQRKRLYHNTV